MSESATFQTSGCTDCGKHLNPDEFWLCFECKAQQEFIEAEFDAEASRRDMAGYNGE